TPRGDTPRRPRPMTRIPRRELLQQLADQLAREAKDGAQPEALTSTLVRLGARQLIEELLGAEAADIVGGRGRSAGREAGQQGPQVRGLEGVCQPSLWGALQRRTEVLERLVVEMYVRGLSTRDIEDGLQELGGEGTSLLSTRLSSKGTTPSWPSTCRAKSYSP